MELSELQQHVRTLVTLEESEWPIVSCHLNSERRSGGFREAFDERVGLLNRTIGNEAQARLAEALARIDAFITEDLRADSRGVASFARGGDHPFFLGLQFQVPMPNWITVGSTPNIYHLVEMKDTYHRCVVMVCRRENIRIFEINLGSVTARLLKERPELRRRVAGWTKEHYQAHLYERTFSFLTDAIAVLHERMAAGGYKHLILFGSPGSRDRVRAALPQELLDRVVDSVPKPESETEPDIVKAAMLSFFQAEQFESLSMVELLVDELRQGGLAIAGGEASREALEQERVDVLVLAAEYDPTTKAELVQATERCGCKIEIVHGSDALDRLGGVGCLLTRQAPESS